MAIDDWGYRELPPRDFEGQKKYDEHREWIEKNKKMHKDNTPEAKREKRVRNLKA